MALDTISRSALWMGMILEDSYGSKETYSNRSQTDVTECIESVTRMLLPILEQRGQKVLLTTEGSFTVATNRVILQRVVMNLLVNASKYGPVQEAIEVHVKALHEMVSVTVQDHGRGISERERSSVFEWGVRGEQAMEGVEPGLGLGLAMVKEVVESEGGSIEVSSGEGTGCAVSFTIPRFAPSVNASTQESDEA
jgi:two-component system CheB/CheR fusion protein